jgi:RNA polymerase sigma factor (TIGR02999 family)
MTFLLTAAPMSDVTEILCAIERGDSQAASQLLPLVYDELRRLAAAKMAIERPDHSLDATALVHEAYMRLAGDQHFENRRHFFAAAGEAMRRVLVDHARHKLSAKRGGTARRLPLADLAAPDADERLLALDEALTQLAAEEPLAARVVELHHFAGLPHDQVAEALDTTVYEVRQKWTYARAWLKAALKDP